MIRLNLVLLLAVLASAFYLVHTQYESRRLYSALYRAQSQAKQLDADHEQLAVQRRAQAAPARVQQLATRHLQMRQVTPGITQYVSGRATAPAAAPRAEGEGAR
ncbi:MAG: cell division protein FtsL [Hydrogenophaga sp.]|uniref:cell division protein FtsL n=1 Tax=Hydrogenophaga sp. TaxID=1904254 RepID=UPI00169DF8CA|nr:cell division protein FtsL [Hydrogenophaga sp.]NIM43064.1 cell division protein FtsL [Hydrogenophaga sp.]NIN28132.1 cell division protein FtsL [Hydrogenophaga sp.]NIN30570.1 cell division protein FtsL [Hydrogenophaga sp.]NIN57267.1 cell division protein FtsL [Hydrogenophaga sp.]NIO51486.1 cell division protein FtsL [Hydrogenophaga sp.]